MTYGAGYYQYRLTLVGVVDNFKIVPLHAFGYLTWRNFWRHHLYPSLAKRFPKWGYFTTLLVWCQHLFVREGITSLQSVKALELARLTMSFRYQPPNVVNTNELGKWQLRSSYLSNEALTPTQNLVDHEVLSLDNVFPFPRFEPFQEESLGYFEDQQDVTLEDDEEPNQGFDIQYGTNQGAYLSEDAPYFLIRDTRRPRQKLTRKIQPYRQVNNEVCDFRLNPVYHRNHGLRFNKNLSLGRLIDAGQGPAALDEEPDFEPSDEETDPGERREELADWYFLSLKTSNVSDLDLLQGESSAMYWRLNSNLWTPGGLSRPWRLYSIARGWHQWWWWSRRLKTRKYYKNMKKYNDLDLVRKRPETVPELRRRLIRQKKKAATFKKYREHSRRARGWWSRQRRERPSVWLDFTSMEGEEGASFSQNMTHGLRYVSRKWAAFRHIWFHSDNTTSIITPFFTERRHSLYQPKPFFAFYKWLGRSTWTHVSRRERYKWIRNRWGAGYIHRPGAYVKEAARLVYPRYRPAYTANSSLEVNELSAVQSTPSTGVSLILLVALIYGILLFVANNTIYGVDYHVGKSIYFTQKPEDWYQSVHIGLPSWVEVYRLSPPRGIHSSLYPGGVDSNIYVWSWWVDYWATSWYPLNETVNNAFELVSHSHWKWFLDTSKLFVHSWPPYIPSWRYLDGKIGLMSAYAVGLEQLEKPSILRSIDNSYFIANDVPAWLYRQIYDSQDVGGTGHVLWSVQWDSTQLAWGNQLGNPTWINPRDFFASQPSHLDARYLRFWENSTRLFNHSTDDAMFRSSFYNLGRTDETIMWPHDMEDVTRGWSAFNVPGLWENHWNKLLLQKWTEEAAKYYADNRDQFWLHHVWVRTIWSRIVLFFSHFVPSVSFVWWFIRNSLIVIGLSVMFRKSWFEYVRSVSTVEVGVTTRPEAVALQVDQPVAPLPRDDFVRVEAVHGFQRLYNQLTNWGEFKEYDRMEIMPEGRPPSWRFNQWDLFFEPVRSSSKIKFNLKPRRQSYLFPFGHQRPLSIRLSRSRVLSTNNKIDNQVDSTVSRVFWSAKTIPLETVKFLKMYSPQTGKFSRPNLTKRKNVFWLSQPRFLFSGSTYKELDFSSPEPRTNRRKIRREKRVVNSYGARPRQYHKFSIRYVDAAVRENPRPIANNSFAGFRRPRIANPKMQIDRQRFHHYSRWSTTLEKLASSNRLRSCGEMSPCSELLLQNLLEVNYPGRVSILNRRVSNYSTGLNWGLYHDDLNDEPFFGHQGDEEIDELEDVDTPFETYDNLATITHVSIAPIEYKSKNNLLCYSAYELSSWTRWCGLPLCWYGSSQVGSSFTYNQGWLVETCHWSPIASDHPGVAILPGLSTYEIPRFYRRLTRWLDIQPDKALHAAYKKPWGTTPSSNLARTSMAGVVPQYKKRFSRRRSWILQRHGGADGGDMGSWSSVASHIQDEFQQFGWGPQHESIATCTYLHDNEDTVSVGTLCEISYVDHSYNGYLCRGWGRSGYKDWTQSSGINLDNSSSGEILVNPGEKLFSHHADPEQILFEWWTPPYWADAYSIESQYLDTYAWERDPEDVFDHLAIGEHNSEVARSRPIDLPEWIIAAAVAGSTEPSEALFDSSAIASSPHPGKRIPIDFDFVRLYYAFWRRKRRQPFWWNNDFTVFSDALDWRVYEKDEVTDGMDTANPGIEGDPLTVNVSEHIRVWALTEVYLRDRPHGRGLNS
jgi:hypothetical protein